MEGELMAEYIVKETSYYFGTQQGVIGELIRCKDCKHFKRNIPCVGGFYDGCDELIDDGNEMLVDENFYCGYAERRTDDTD